MQRKPCSNCGKLGHWHRDGKHKGKGSHGRSGSFGNGGSQPQHGGSRGRRHASPGPSALMATVKGAHNQVKSDVVEWCLDSAATINVCNDLTCFSDIATVSDGPTMSCASGNLVSLNQVGSVELCVVNELTGQQEKRLLSDVYYLPDAPANLLSQDYMQTELKYFVKMPGDQSTCILSKPGMRIKFVKVNGLYRLWSVCRQQTQHPAVFSALTKRIGDVPLSVWHKRFAHASETTILEMTRKSIVQGLQVNREGAGCIASCLPCIHGKRVRMSYNGRVRYAEKPLQRLHVDVCTVNELSVDGSISYLLVVDEFSRYKWIFLRRYKSEAKEHLIPMINRLHNKYRAKKWRVEEIHSDQGGEFDNNSIRDFSDKEGIELTQTNGYTPQETGIVERANGIVLPKVRALLHMTNMPDFLWGEAAQHVVYTLNVTATRGLNGLTPHEKLSGEKPGVSCLQTWGCLCYYHRPSESRSKKKKLLRRGG